MKRNGERGVDYMCYVILMQSTFDGVILKNEIMTISLLMAMS